MSDPKPPLAADTLDGLVRAVSALFGTGLWTEREASVLRMRLVERQTLRDVGKHFNVTRERIRQIEAKALRKMRGRICPHAHAEGSGASLDTLRRDVGRPSEGGEACGD